MRRLQLMMILKALHSALSSLGNCCLIPGTELQNKLSAYDLVEASQMSG